MRIAVIVFVILAIIAVVFASMYIGRRNEMVRLNTTVQAQWSDVDVVLQRRADLIPNLVETVKGYARHEVTVFEAIANARAALNAARTPADRIAANAQLDGALARLLVIVENYPNLKANENFLRLQDELAGTENRIAVERRKYNEMLLAYNTYVQLFPNNFFARWAGFQPNDAYFKAGEGSREAPKVNFVPVPAPAPGR